MKKKEKCDLFISKESLQLTRNVEKKQLFPGSRYKYSEVICYTVGLAGAD